MPSLENIAPVEHVFDPGASRGLPIPWWAKIGAKIVLSRLLPSYDLRKSLGLFRHGNLDLNLTQHGSFVAAVLARHEEYAGKASAILELGPGNSLGTALFASAHGVGRIWLADVGDFASDDMALYREIARLADEEHPGSAARFDLTDRARMLASTNASYLTNGVASLSEIPSGSLDVILSTAVLEHVRRAEFPMLVGEMFRVLRPGGTAYHEIDLMDHLGGAQNHLRFSEKAWEHPLMAKSGFYTNRLRSNEIVALMRAGGFEAAITRVARWPAPPTPRGALAEPFRSMPEEELSIANFGVMLRKPSG